MVKEFHQTVWDDRLRKDWEAILRLAIMEDLGEAGDWTSRALVPEGAMGRAEVVARQSGVVAGLPAVEPTLTAFDLLASKGTVPFLPMQKLGQSLDPRLRWLPKTEDGQPIAPGQSIGTIEGPARAMLAAERVLLNLLGRLSGIATLTRRYVEAVAGTKAKIYDTRKTTPGWRRLEKYAVRCGGGWNHRGGLDEAVLIKDNHLAIGERAFALGAEGENDFTQGVEGDSPIFAAQKSGQSPAQKSGQSPVQRFSPSEAVVLARSFVERHAADPAMPIEVEVDSLEQLDAVLPVRPDIVLLDNMNPAQLCEAVARRDAFHRMIELEASGGVRLDTVRQIAESGVDRISVGALTHSAVALDFGLDWE